MTKIKIIGGLIIFLGVLIGVCIPLFSQDRPVGTPGNEAEILATKISTAIDLAAWDTTHCIAWTFAGNHHFVWQRQMGMVQVRWKKYRVVLNTDNGQGAAWKSGTKLSADAADKTIEKALHFFYNDSFWLNAPSKIYDEGTSREAVRLKDGSTGLLVTYSNGGITPGDAYLWLTNENGLPDKWKMWVKIIPIGGLATSWEDWVTLYSGAKIATTHKAAGFKLKITNLKAAPNMEALGESSSIFNMDD